MSVANVEHPNRSASHQDRMIELPASIQEKLTTVIRQSGRAELVHRVSVAADVIMLTIIGLLVADVLFELRATPIRWALWIVGLGVTVAALCYCLIKPRLGEDRLLDAAWKIESAHPAMEERLTSTVQFLNAGSRRNSSSQLINAVVNETSEAVDRIDAESIPSRSLGIPVTMATSLAMALVFSVAFWPQAVLTSIQNLATPWAPYIVPNLAAMIIPGDTTIVEGQSVNIQVIASEVLAQPILEVIQGENVESHAMVTTSPEVATFALTEVKQDAVYRVHSGGLYSLPHTITVLPQPELTSITASLEFPDYTNLDPLTIEQVFEPIEAPVGTEVTLTAISDAIAVDGVIQWGSDSKEVLARKLSDVSSADSSVDAVNFEWKFKIEPETNLVGTLRVRSEHNIDSLSYPIEIRALEDSPPNVEINAPTLRQLSLRRDSELPIRYRAIDDFGLSKAEMMVKFGKQEPVAFACSASEEQPVDRLVWTGATSLELSEVPADCRELSLWLRVADNRPDQFGGPQVTESEAIHITLDDSAESFGQQQILADRKIVEQALGQAIEQMRQALKAAEALQNERDVTADGTDQGAEQDQKLAANEPGLGEDQPNARTDQIATLRRETSNAKQTLDQLASKLQDEPNLFEPKAAEIQAVSDDEVTEALELANEIPLTDDQSQQDELANDAKEQLTSAIDQLENLKSDIIQQAERMEQAAQLDQLASKQERLARKAAADQQDQAPEQEWKDRQEQVADDLENMVEENKEVGEQEQLLKQADQAEQLADQAEKLAQQQQQLEQAMREAQQKGAKSEEAEQQLKDLIKAQRAEIDQQANEKEQQRLNEAEKAVQEGDLDQAAAKIQEQIAQRAEQIQQQAEQLAKQDNPEPAIQERAKQAAEQLERAREKAEQANQSLCEKCNGGDQSKPGEQYAKPSGKIQDAKTGGENLNKQQTQEADANDAEPQQQATEQDDAKIRRDQQGAAQSLQEAAQSLNQVCEACRECVNCNKPGSSGGTKSGGSQDSGSAKPDSPKNGKTADDPPAERSSTEKQLEKASSDAKQAAKSPSNQEAAEKAESVAEQLNQLADDAAQESGYSLRQQKGSRKDTSKQQGTGDKSENNDRSGQPGKPSGDPQGVGKSDNDSDINGQKLRGESNSNWTRSRRKLEGGVLDDREGNVPEQYRGVVKRYFEELSRQQSDRSE